ncbi:hypothetical protein HS088_TW03G00277 [Tripterygium wilfordii]|uniref:Protein trichome birefringence-like 19 n=2 Tax=Tripterygium wilfordii TaxID=458696 RepID=A0A7J7DUB2_TRIWF|nr:hypothetical protein HS088_TW03G00277 [Tripterygium wilfordii]
MHISCFTQFSNMKNLDGKNTQQNSSRKLLLLALILVLLTIIPLCMLTSSHLPQSSPNINRSSLKRIKSEKQCDVYSGKWVPYPKGPYYTNATCHLIIDQQNCMKSGRQDTEFMKWRWKPYECELSLFDANQFLELVRGKSMAFVGDSVGRNQMQSLLCLLGKVVYPQDLSYKYTSDTNSKHYFYADYKFNLATLWSPFLVKTADADPSGHSFNSLMNLYLDEADEAWVSQIERFDYVIISAGQWFFRPLVYYKNRKVVGCHICHNKNITAVSKYYGYKMAFRTAFQTLIRLRNYKGITILRTFSPAHFENGAWNEGGNCARTRPFTSQEMKLDGYILDFYLTQVEELRKAEKQARRKGLKFTSLNTTEAMLLRPDGHPNHSGRSPHGNSSAADCVHWCLPGPIDTWNEFLFYVLKQEG